MHLGLVMCDASIVTVLLCLKVNFCQIIKQTHSTCTLEFEMKGNYQSTFPCCSEIVGEYKHLYPERCIYH